MGRYQRPSSVKEPTPYQVFLPTEPSQLPASQAWERNGNLSPAQQIAYDEMDKRGITPELLKKFIPIIKIMKPDIALGIDGMFKLLEMPEVLHRALEETVSKLQEVIVHDHNAGIHAERDGTQSEAELRWLGVSSSSIRSREEGDGQVYSVGNTDGGISENIQSTEGPSTDTDSGHEATIQIQHGDERVSNEMES